MILNRVFLPNTLKVRIEHFIELLLSFTRVVSLTNTILFLIVNITIENSIVNAAKTMISIKDKLSDYNSKNENPNNNVVIDLSIDVTKGKNNIFFICVFIYFIVSC